MLGVYFTNVFKQWTRMMVNYFKIQLIWQTGETGEMQGTPEADCNITKQTGARPGRGDS